jgi:hypothetical protein
MTDPAFAFGLGFCACAGFFFIAEIVARLIERRRILKRLEPLHEFESTCCPWPVDAKFPHRLSGVPKFDTAARQSREANAGSGAIVQLHKNVSSRFLSSGSERPL